MRNYKGPLFQHRHYAAMADYINTFRQEFPEHEQAIDAFTLHLIKRFKGTNPGFDSHRFTKASIGEPINGKDRR